MAGRNERGSRARTLVFQPEFLEDLKWWVGHDRKTALRVFDLIESVSREPTKGVGKPESLRHVPGAWSRRITQEHRLVYLVRGDRIDFLQARYHY